MALIDTSQLNNIANGALGGLNVGAAAASKVEKFFGLGAGTPANVGKPVPKDTGIRPIGDFISTVKTNGLAQTNHFTFDVILPTPVRQACSSFLADNKFLNLMCSSTELPSVNIATVPIRHFGEQIEMPNDKNYGSVRATFYVDASLYVKAFFDRWVEFIIDPQTREYNFYSNYVTQISINVYDKHGFLHHIVKLDDAYPKSIGAVSLSHESRDVMKLDVEFMYRRFVAQNVENTLFDYGDQSANTEPTPSWSQRLQSYAGQFKDYQNRFNNAVGDISRSQNLISKGDFGGFVGQNFGGGWF